MNLLKLFTAHGEVYVDAAQLADTERALLTLYTVKGNRLADVGRTKAIREKAEFGVHRDNLFATREHADKETDRILRELFGEKALTAKQLREGVIVAVQPKE